MKNFPCIYASIQLPTTIIFPGSSYKLLATANPPVDCKINCCSLAVNFLDVQGSVWMHEANEGTDFSNGTATSCSC